MISINFGNHIHIPNLTRHTRSTCDKIMRVRLLLYRHTYSFPCLSLSQQIIIHSFCTVDYAIPLTNTIEVMYAA